MDTADPDRNGLEAGAPDNNQECGELIKRTGNKNDLAILTSEFSFQQLSRQIGIVRYTLSENGSRLFRIKRLSVKRDAGVYDQNPISSSMITISASIP